MVDINKYFNTQLALAKQRNVNKESKKNYLVSRKSKSAAELISKKQDRSLTKNNLHVSLENNDTRLHESFILASTKFDFDDENLSWDDKDVKPIAGPSKPRVKHKLKKIIDDGKRTFYKKRVSKWRNSLSAAKFKKFDGSYHSADIQYILHENGDPEDIHELQNGLRIPKFIWKQLYKYQRTGVKWLWELHQVQSGGMLGDEMGLGKTVQIIAFLAGLFKSDDGPWRGLGPSIIVTPATVIYQWVSHFHYWCPQLRVAVLHHTGSHNGSYKKLIRDMYAAHGILLISYAGIVKYTKDLLSKKWHYIILDEGHKIRNPETQVSKLVKNFQTPHKLLITGSPMQNSLQELWSLFDFMRPGLLGTYNAFMEHFAIPIAQGGYANATELQIVTALEIAKTLKNMIIPYLLRRTKTEVQEHIKLPEKIEQVLFCALSKEQRDLYMGYLMSGIVKNILDKGPVRARMLVALSTLSKICNHPDLYLCKTLENFEIKSEEFGHWKRSGKMCVVHSLLKLWKKQGHRTLIFSQSRAMIGILERHLHNHEFKYLKMDGTVSISQRQNLIKTFNENSQYLIFLSTTRVGGLGINLTGADRVIIYDPDWNPATDNQAKERAWRIGQQKNVTVYRLISAGTIEEKIYQRQIFKNSLSHKIFIDPHQKNVFTTSNLQGLFTLDDLNCDGDTETTSLFKHTKVNLYYKNEEIPLKHSKSFTEKKVDEMRKRAKEISKIISKVNANKNVIKNVDLPEPFEPKICLLENRRTNQIDINKHSNKYYEKIIMKGVVNSQSVVTEEDGRNNYTKTVGNRNETEPVNVEEDAKFFNTKEISLNLIDQGKSKKEYNLLNFEPLNELETTKRIELAQIRTSWKRKHFSSSESHIENLLDVKKIKNKKHKKDTNLNDNDYVLSKLFAMTTVKNALQHDMIGLAEKERKHGMKELAVENANKALKAIKLSMKQC